MRYRDFHSEEGTRGFCTYCTADSEVLALEYGLTILQMEYLHAFRVTSSGFHRLPIRVSLFKKGICKKCEKAGNSRLNGTLFTSCHQLPCAIGRGARSRMHQKSSTWLCSRPAQPSLLISGASNLIPGLLVRIEA